MGTNEKYSVGDLVRVPHLPRKMDDSTLWRPDPRGPYSGIVVKENADHTKNNPLIGQCLIIKLSTGESVKLSSNLVEKLY